MNNAHAKIPNPSMNPKMNRSKRVICLKNKKLQRYPGIDIITIPVMSFINSNGSIDIISIYWN
jgi:hypothetical protein